MQSVISSARTIPARFYTCPSHFKLEVEKIFHRNWLQVALLNQLQSVGNYVSGSIARQPYLVVRSADGLKGFDNVCRHHGTLLTTKGCGTFDQAKVTCCYHGWTYNLEGRLIKATRLKGIEDFQAKNYGLQPLPVKCLGDLVFIHFDQNVKGEANFTPVDVDFNQLTFVRTKTYQLNCNWKVYVDNYLDGGYHVEYAHKKLASHLDLSTYKTTLYDRYNVQSVANKSTDSRISRPATYTWIYPNLMLNRYGKWLDTNTVYPISADKCEVTFNWFIEKGESIDNLHTQLDDSNEVQIEDEILCERVQEGMNSKYFDRGRYAPNVEQGMYQFHDLLLKDLQMTLP